MPANTSVNLGELDRPVRIVAASHGQSASAYIRQLIRDAIDREVAKRAELSPLLKGA